MAYKNELPIIEFIQIDESFTVKNDVIEFYASLDEFTFIGPKELKIIQTGVKINIPTGYCVLITVNYELLKKSLLTLASGCVILYPGMEDEIELSLINLTRKQVIINHGDCIAVGILLKISDFTLKNVDTFNLIGGLSEK
jgi:dUTPase